MSTFTVRGTDLGSEQVTDALRKGLGPGYEVVPGMRMPRSPFGRPRPDNSDVIMVGKAGNPFVRAEVSLIRRRDRTEVRIRPGGIAGDLIMNTLGLARTVRRVLHDAPDLGSS